MTSAFHVAKRTAGGKQLAVSVVGTFITPNNIWVLLGRQKRRMDPELSVITRYVKINKKQSLPLGYLQSREKKDI